MTHEALPFTIDLLASLLLVAGGAFALVGAIGLARLRDFYLRLHAPTTNPSCPLPANLTCRRF